jgi:Transposase DDE domain
VPLERLAALAKSRWTIEQFYEYAKGKCGMGDYQSRRWEGLHRHLAFSMVAYSLLMLHSSVTAIGAGSSSGEVIFPLGKAHNASGNPQAGTGVAAGGPGSMVHRN